MNAKKTAQVVGPAKPDMGWRGEATVIRFDPPIPCIGLFMGMIPMPADVEHAVFSHVDDTDPEGNPLPDLLLPAGPDGQFASPVPIWEGHGMTPEAVIEELGYTLGDLSGKPFQPQTLAALEEYNRHMAEHAALEMMMDEPEPEPEPEDEEAAADLPALLRALFGAADEPEDDPEDTQPQDWGWIDNPGYLTADD